MVLRSRLLDAVRCCRCLIARRCAAVLCCACSQGTLYTTSGATVALVANDLNYIYAARTVYYRSNDDITGGGATTTDSFTFFILDKDTGITSASAVTQTITVSKRYKPIATADSDSVVGNKVSTLKVFAQDSQGGNTPTLASAVLTSRCTATGMTMYTSADVVISSVPLVRRRGSGL